MNARALNKEEAMNIQSILVATDLSAQEDIAVQRAMRLAKTHRATVTLMYLPSAGQEVQATAGARLAKAARQLEERLELRVRTVPIQAHKVEDLVARAKGMDLVVLGKRRTSAWEDFFCGSVAHQVLSWGSSDVLVVPHAHLQESARLAVRRMKRGLPEAALEIRPAGRRAS